MKNIRHLFETNSSSSHSITINNDTNLFTSILPDKDGNITLEGGEFGWEVEKYRDALTKSNYCAVFASGDEKMTEMLKQVISKQTGAKNVIILADTDDYKSKYSSYIDHQSARYEGGACLEAFESEDNLRNFIFNNKSVLYIDNDNY